MGIGKPREGTYGIMAEFGDPQSLLEAANATREAGYTELDAYSPFPIHGLSDAIGFGRTKLSGLVLAMGLLGGFSGFFMCWYANVVTYPLNIGGKPFSPWPAWIPITFECTILFAAFGAVLGMLALNGLPMPYHPVFNVKRFENASRDRFFLVIQSRDPKFDADSVYKFMDT
ncbi:MAG TPA: DUF3341 domain-containing protein, partial [Thermoanaerobaculia bacterium]|nr:DUF3341 domain-containing protein [Thermoanaerobaculia bacterium]